MDGGLLQLIAKGSEDLVLTGNPEITPFKKIYRKIGLFSLMDSEVILDNISFEKIKQSKIPKLGDLISKIYLELSIEDIDLKKIETFGYTDEIFIDEKYQLKLKIIKKILEIDNLEELKIDDETIIKMSHNSTSKNILLATKNKIKNITNVTVNYDNNYEIISYLLASNLDDSDLILGDFILRYLDTTKTLTNSSQYLELNYSQIYSDLIENYYIYLNTKNSEDYQLNNEIINELVNYLYNEEKGLDLSYISEVDKNVINYIKENLEYDMIILKKLLNFLFPDDNFRNGKLSESLIYPFFIYLFYDPNNNNKIRYNLTDQTITSANLIKDYDLNTITPVVKKLLESFEQLNVEVENYFKSVNYQKMLGDNPSEILSILISITEIWKWQNYDFLSPNTYQLISGLEILNNSQNLLNIDSFVEAISYFQDIRSIGNKELNIQDNLTIDFERKKDLLSLSNNDYTNIIEVIDDVNKQLKNITTFNLSGIGTNSNYLNRTSIDLSLILVYIVNLFKEDLLSKNIFNENASKSWINFVNETINSKMYCKWFSEGTSRIDENYVGPKVFLDQAGQVGLKLDDKIPLSILPNNVYQLTSEKIKSLIKLQTHKFNYICELNTINNKAIGDYNLKTIKKLYNLNLSIINENNVNYLVINDNLENVWYHHFLNEYVLVGKNNQIKLNFHAIKNNLIYFIINQELNLNDFNLDYLKVVINNNIYINSNGKNIIFNKIINNTSFTSDELDYYYFFKIYYDKFNNKIDLRIIPKIFIEKNNNSLSNNYKLENEIEYVSSNIYYINQLSLPNFIEYYDLNRDYYTFRQYLNLGSYGVSKDTTVKDNYYKFSYMHHEIFIQKSFIPQFQLYHLPYKINNQIYNNIKIVCETYLDNEKINILGRFGNNFNIRESKLEGTNLNLRCYSEGIDFYDINLDYLKINNISNIEEDHMKQLSEILINYYNNQEHKYEKIVKANDIISNGLINKLLDCLKEISEIGPIYKSIIEKVMLKSEISLEKLKYYSGSNFNDNKYWCSQFDFTNSFEYIKDFFTKNNLTFAPTTLDLLTWDKFKYDKSDIISGNQYLPKNLLSSNSINYINNYSKNFLNQLNNIEENLDIINSYPRISNSLLDKNELDHLIKRNYSTIIKENLYEYEAVSNVNLNNNLYLGNNKLEVNNEDLISKNLINDIHNSNSYDIKEIKESIFKTCFYDYGLTINKKIIFLPNDFVSYEDYELLDEDLDELNLEYEEINSKFIIFKNTVNMNNIISIIKNNLIILRHKINGSILPYGKIYPDLTNPYKYYRLFNNSQKISNLLFENNLVENINQNENIIYFEDFVNTEKIINPIYNSIKLNLEYYDLNFTIYNKIFNLISDLKINKFDFIFINNKWIMFDNFNKLNINDISGKGFYIFRFLTNSIRNINIFDTGFGYDFSNVNLLNLLLLCDELEFIKVKNNKIVDSELLKLKEGDFLLNKKLGIIHQVIKNSNNILQVYPEMNIEEDLQLIKNIIFDNITEILNSSEIILYDNKKLNLQYLIENVKYTLPIIYEKNLWEYRDVLKGDLYFKNNSLELSNSNLSKNWIYKSKDKFVSFINIIDNWYKCDSLEIQVGDYIYDLEKLAESDYLNNPDTYLHTGLIQSKVLGINGEYIKLSNFISDKIFLVKSYPIIIKPSIQEINDSLYHIYQNNIILKNINFKSVQLNQQKYSIDILSNKLNIKLGYDNNLKQEIIFNKNNIYPKQNILINSEWNSIKDFETLELNKNISNGENYILEIPDITKITNISEDNLIIDNLKYLDSLTENNKIFCSIILYDNLFLNNLTYCDELLLEKNQRNLLTFKFNNNSLEEKMLSLDGDAYITNIYININNVIILKGTYDSINNKLYGYKSLNSEIELLKLINVNHYDLYMGNKENNNMNLLSSQKINNKFIFLKNLYETVFYNIQNRPLGINLDFLIYKYNILYKSINYRILEEYPKKNIFLSEFNVIDLIFINNVEKINNKYILELDNLIVNQLNILDDKKIYQIKEDKLVEMIIKENNGKYILESDILIDVNNNFYQKINHRIKYFIEKLLENKNNIYPLNKYYFHYRIGFEEKNETNNNKYLLIYDFIPKQDLNEFGNNINTEVILNSNLQYYFDMINLPVLNIRKGTLNIPSNQNYSKESKILELPSSDIDYSVYYDYSVFDLFPSQSDLLVYQENKNELYENLIKNELDFENNSLLEYSKENYLLVNIINHLDWKKHIDLSNNIGILQTNNSIFNNQYTSQEDFNLYQNMNLSEDIKIKQDNILLITKNIFNLIPQWIFYDEFKINPDDFLNKYLIKNYNLEYINNKFKNIDGSNYLEEIVPTYFKIIKKENNYNLEYIVKNDNIDNNINYNLFEELVNNNISHELGLKLSNLIDFYKCWDKIKLGYKELYTETDIYLSKNSINLRLEQIYRKNILDLFSDKIYKGNVIDNSYETENIFEYLVDLTSLPDYSELYYLDFKERDLVFNDINVEYNFPKKDKSKIMLNKYLPNQNIDLYGNIKYEIINNTYIGNQYQITLPENSLPNINFNIYINNKEIDYKLNDKLIINYDNLLDINSLDVRTKINITLKKGKYYIDSNIINWIDNNTFILINNNLEELVLDSNIILSPKPQSSNIILVKQSKILSKINLNKYNYQLELNKDFNNTPSLGYEVKPQDLTINNINAIDYQIKDNNKINIIFDKKLNILDELNQTFKINYQNKYSILEKDLEKSVIEFGDINNVNLLNNFYINITNKFNNELGNYIYKINISTNQKFNNKKVYYKNNNNLELLGKIMGSNSTGYYLITIKKIHDNNNYININSLITLDTNSDIEILSIEYLMKNNILLIDYSYKLSDIINQKINLNLFNVYLEEEIVLENINNEIIKELNILKDNLQPNKNYERYEKYIVNEKMELNEDFGYDIVKSMKVIMNNAEVETFDNKMFRDYIFYNIKKEKQELYNKMLNNNNRVIIPLPFWFCRNWNNSLPIVLGNEVDFYLEFNFNKLSKLVKNTGEIINKPKLTGKLVYQTIWLSDDEKKIMSNGKQDYLIETYQKSQIENIYKINQEINLNLKGAVKDFYFSFYLDDTVKNNYQEEILIDKKYIYYKNLSKDEIDSYIKIIDSKEFLNLYENIILRYLNYCNDKYYIGFLIIENLKFNANSNLLQITRSLAYYFSKYYLESEIKVYNSLKDCSLILNSYEHVRNKSDIFWSCKNQLKYENSGNLNLYGYSYSLHPLELQPSGYVNHNLIDSKLIINLNDDYFEKVKANNNGITMELYYRKYRLLRFMGNQAGLLF